MVIIVPIRFGPILAKSTIPFYIWTNF